MLFSVLLFTPLVVHAYVIERSAPSTPCGTPVVQPNTNKIVGGQEAKQGSWPWMGMIVDGGHPTISNGSIHLTSVIQGSATILGPHVLLTTAQHFEGEHFSVFDLDLRHYRVYVGQHRVNQKDIHEQYYHIRRVLIHPGFNPKNLENDVALVITVEQIQYNDHTRPACLPDSSHMYHTGNTCYLAGWGDTVGTASDEVLNQVQIPVLADSVCQAIWTSFLPNTEICAGYETEHKDFCPSDIGSPLNCRDSNGKWYVQGLASSGGHCRLTRNPGVYEDLSQYTEWIKTTMSQAGYPYQYAGDANLVIG